MDSRSDQHCEGFSLTEILLAVGTLAIGMIFIGGTFLVGIHFAAVSTEQTIAAIAAEEAFAKIQLITKDPCCPILATDFDYDIMKSFEQVANNIRIGNGLGSIKVNEFSYPSTSNIEVTRKQYYWSCLCRRVGLSNVQATVFISRKLGGATLYPGGATRPTPMEIGVSGSIGSDALVITEIDKISWINDGYKISDNQTGQIYRVLRREYPPNDNRVKLQDNWQGSTPPDKVWVVPPAVGGSRNPCIAIYQEVIRF
jgi:type II secretory pathway pseudopilin PulG